MTEAARSPKITPGMLSDREPAILDFEKSWWQAKAAKEIEIRDRFDMSASRYYQILYSLFDLLFLLSHCLLLVKRLRRMREQRQRNRSAARLTVR